MKQFNIPCFFNGAKSSVTVYIGNPLPDHNPIHFQSDWLSKERGGSIPQEILDSLNKILALSIKNNVPFLELCEYALNAANESIAANQNSTQTPAVTQEKDVKADIVEKNGNGVFATAEDVAKTTAEAEELVEDSSDKPEDTGNKS